MDGRDVVVVGASAGGVGVLRTLAAALPADLPAAAVVVLHVAPSGPPVMAAILDRSGPVPARTAPDGERLQRGTLLLAPSGRDRTLASSPSGPVVSLSPAGQGHEPGAYRPGVDELLLNEDLRVSEDEAVGVGDWALAVLGALGSAVLVLDPPAPSGGTGRTGRVRVWNPASAELWGVRADEAVDADLADLDVGLPLEAVGAACVAVLADGEPRDLALEGVERHGRTVALRVRVSVLPDAAGRAVGTVVAVDVVADGAGAVRPRSG